MTQNDTAWEKIFDKYNILKHIAAEGQYVIQANDIKEFREPRLMTKFDHQQDLPQLFKSNRLSILPITRGSYIIAPFITFWRFEDVTSDIKRVYVPEHIQSLMPENIMNEAMALDCAYSCGILEDFLEDEALFPTVSGRMGSGKFDFKINTTTGEKNIRVDSSQIEIDAAYEGLRYLSLFEAKSEIYDDFLIRQLYYPFRAWSTRVTKDIKSVFLVYSNGKFNLYQYKFIDPQNYNSLQLVKQSNFLIATSINVEDILKVIKDSAVSSEPEIPFPQADSMSRIINLLETLNKHDMSKSDITSFYSFDERQTNYYTDAGRYLGLIDKKTTFNKVIMFSLSALGKRIMNLPYKERQLGIISQIVKHSAFRTVLSLHLKYGEMPNRNKVINIMKDSHLYNINSEETYNRRASTIIGWVNWILTVIE